MAQQKRDYYEVLGLNKGASDADIKKAYRQQAKSCHPDLNPGDAAAEARFKEIGEAYGVLSDGDKKARYDQFGHAGVDPNFGAGGGFGGGFDMGDMDLCDIFGSFFGGGFGGGGGQRRSGPKQGATLRASLKISFEEAAFGCEKEITLTRNEGCDDCQATGCQPGTTADTCPDCRGAGVVRIQRGNGGFAFTSTAPCNRCSGKGKIIHSPCRRCNGDGIVRRQKKMTINIPAGINDGQAISLRGQGNVGKGGGPAGDLVVGIVIRPHDKFRRDGNTVLLEKTVSFVQASLGAELELDTIDGKVKYNLPAGTQSGTTFRLRGKGIPDVRTKGRGDQYVSIRVEIPKSLTAPQREALHAFGVAMGDLTDEGEKKSGFFEKKKKKK